MNPQATPNRPATVALAAPGASAGRLVFITGASSGIGQALAQECLQRGWRVALVARRLDALEQWIAQQGVGADRARPYAADVTDSAAFLAAARRCRDEWGLPDIVIANAGISVGMDTREHEDLQVMQDTFALNNLGMATTFHAFLADMQARGSGSLVGIASVAAIRGLPGHGAYCASKSAVVAYCESLRGECRGTGVRVVTLLPGYIATPLTAGNPYPMPFLMPAERFAAQALDTIERGASYRVIPWQMAWVARLLRLLPNRVFDRLFAGRGRKPRRSR
jgi:short-subunit dehydrogenase